MGTSGHLSCIYLLSYVHQTPSLCGLCPVLALASSCRRGGACAHTTAPWAERSEDQNRRAARGHGSRGNGKVTTVRGLSRALWARWLLSWAPGGRIGFQQVDGGGPPATLLFNSLSRGCALKTWSNHPTSPEPQPKWLKKATAPQGLQFTVRVCICT